MTLLNNNSELRNYRIHLNSKTTGNNFPLLEDYDSVTTKVLITETIDSPTIMLKITLRASNVIDHIAIGDEIRLFAPTLHITGRVDPPELKHRAIILTLEIDDDSNMVTIEAYNQGYMLERNDWFLMIKPEETCSEFIRRTSQDAGIPIDNENFVSTSFKHPAKVWNKTSLYDIWKSLLITSMYNENKPYFIRVSPKGVQLLDLDDDNFQDTWIFEHSGAYANLIGAKRKTSIKDPKFANRVMPNVNEKVLEYADQLPGLPESEFAPVINQESIDKYGLFTTYININNSADFKDVVERMELIAASAIPSDKITFRTYAINSINPPDKIVIVSRNLRTSGFYYIEDLSTELGENSFWHNITATKYRNIPDLLLRDIESKAIPDEYYTQIATPQGAR